MSKTEDCWVSLDGEKSQLIHVNDAGLCTVNHTRDVVVNIQQRLERGDDPAGIAEIPGRIPWTSVLWLDHSPPRQISWRYEVPGHGSFGGKFEASSASDCALLTDAVARLSGMSRTTRKQTSFESVKEPVIAIVSALFVGGVLWSQLGVAVTGGGSRAGARAALIGTVANGLGAVGIIGLTLLVVVGSAIMVALRLRNPATVHRLERSSPAEALLAPGE